MWGSPGGGVRGGLPGGILIFILAPTLSIHHAVRGTPSHQTPVIYGYVFDAESESGPVSNKKPSVLKGFGPPIETSMPVPVVFPGMSAGCAPQCPLGNPPGRVPLGSPRMSPRDPWGSPGGAGEGGLHEFSNVCSRVCSCVFHSRLGWGVRFSDAFILI